MKNLSMDKETITFDMIGAAYVAEADTRRAYEVASRRYENGRGTIEQVRKLQDAADAARRERARLVTTFAGAVRTTSVTAYSDAA